MLLFHRYLAATGETLHRTSKSLYAVSTRKIETLVKELLMKHSLSLFVSWEVCHWIHAVDSGICEYDRDLCDVLY